MGRPWIAGVPRKHVKAHSQAHTAREQWEFSQAFLPGNEAGDKKQ